MLLLPPSLVAQRLKHLPAMQKTWVRSLGWEDPLEKEMATHFSILAWRIPWMEERSRLQSMGFFSSTWACPMQIGLSQECCLFCLKSSLWSSYAFSFQRAAGCSSSPLAAPDGQSHRTGLLGAMESSLTEPPGDRGAAHPSPPPASTKSQGSP